MEAKTSSRCKTAAAFVPRESERGCKRNADARNRPTPLDSALLQTNKHMIDDDDFVDVADAVRDDDDSAQRATNVLTQKIYDCRCAPDLSRGDSVLLPTIQLSFGLADI